MPLLQADATQALVLTQDVTEQETRVEQLSLLRELSQILQGTLDTERLNHVILLCVTTGHALGFNRAFLFMRNRAANTLDAVLEDTDAYASGTCGCAGPSGGCGCT